MDNEVPRLAARQVNDCMASDPNWTWSGRSGHDNRSTCSNKADAEPHRRVEIAGASGDGGVEQIPPAGRYRENLLRQDFGVGQVKLSDDRLQKRRPSLPGLNQEHPYVRLDDFDRYPRKSGARSNIDKVSQVGWNDA